MADRQPSAAAVWGPEALAAARRWVRTWQETGPELERIRLEEVRQTDAFTVISRLCGSANYHVAPYAPKDTSGLVEQQRLFQKLRR